MSYKYLHIVCLDAPAPPDYGGAIETYYKIVALAKAGVRVTVHYFDYNKARDMSGLEAFCYRIYTYKRTKGIKSLISLLPYIVSSRLNKKLIENLNSDTHPILLEGIHCAGIVPYIKGNNRPIVIRIHNNEAIYYKHLAKAESNLFKKLYFTVESRLLYGFQKKLSPQAHYACLSEKDVEQFRINYHLDKVHFIPCFITWQTVNIDTGFGQYCLYHGNMAVAENEKAAIWLIQNVFHQSNKKFIIAGKGISERLAKLAATYNVVSINNPTPESLNELVSKAHINIIHSVNETGVKLKLLHALLQGRHCIANKAGAEGSAINNGLHIANNSKEYKTLIDELFQKSFTNEDAAQRAELLNIYNNESNAQKLITLLYSHYP